MKNIQEVFNEIQDLKRKCKEIGREYHDVLFQADGYEDLKEEMGKLRDKKKLIETGVQAEMKSQYEELEKIKTEIGNLEQMLTDIAMSTLMKGENINITDQYDAKYEPIYKIAFKRIG
jgi:hypothetical protein